jgi:hypothetical protein
MSSTTTSTYDEIVAVKNRFEKSTEQELIGFLYSFHNKWILNNNKNISVLIENAIKHFNLNGETFTYEDLNNNYKKCLYNIVYLQQSFIIKLNNDDRFDDFQKMFNKIFESIDYSSKILKISNILINSHSEEGLSISDDLGLLRFLEPNMETNSPFQNLLLFLLDSIYTSGLQRYQGSLYEKIIIDGNFTHAWKEKITIRNFIYDKTQYNIDYRQWHNVTSNSGNIKNATDFLENCQDPRIIDLHKDRHVFAFKNGIYNCKEWDPENKMYIDHFYEYGSTDIKNLDLNVVASKFFNVDFNNFDEIDDWYNISTPNFQSILDYQNFSEEVSRWIYVFIGRLFYNLGELDNWQVALFLEGVAGSGKSTVTKIVKKFYEVCDVGVLSNNIEKKFGLSSLKDKLIYLAPEIKGDLCLEQSEFQLLIEGGDMQLPEKYKESKYIEWKTPGLFAGNEPPNYTDNSGSISRRLVVAKFHKKVTMKDSDLDYKLVSELPWLIKKSASAYLSAINEYKGKDFWNSLPEYFRETQKDMAQNTHALEHFISSGKVVLGEEYYCREKVFVQAFNEHCKECHLDRHKFTSDYYMGVFGNYALSIKKNIKMKYPDNSTGRIYQGSFIFGIDLINEMGDPSGNNIEDEF